MFEEKKLEMPFIAILPYRVLIEESLPPACKIHFSILCGLSKKFGYCFASDKQLAELQYVSVPTIESWNLQLEKLGFIKRITINEFIPECKRGESKQSFRKRRKIYTNEAFVSKEDCETLDFKGSEEPLENKGYKDKPLTTNNNNNSSEPVVVSSESDNEKRKMLVEFAFDANTLSHLCTFSLEVISQALEAYRANPPGKITHKEGYIRNAIENGWKPPMKEPNEDDKNSQLVKTKNENHSRCKELYEKYKPYIKFKGILDFKVLDDAFEIRPYNGSISRIPFSEPNCLAILHNHIDNAMKIINNSRENPDHQ